MMRKPVLAALMTAVMAAASVLLVCAAEAARPEEAPAEYMLDWSNLHMGTLIHSKVMDRDTEKVKRQTETEEEKMTI